MIPVLLMVMTAQAGEIEGLFIDDFGGGRRGAAMAGNDQGWEAGYEGDSWWSVQGTAFSLSDDGVEDPNGRYGSGWAADNWLLNGPDVQDGVFRLVGQNDDDDFLGGVFQHDGVDSFFLVGVTANSAPPPLDTQDPRQGGKLIIYRVESGIADVLLVEPVDRQEGALDLEISFDQETLTVRAGDELFEVQTAPIGPGRAGFYGYNTGFDGNNAENAYFFSYGINWLDTDDDTIANDFDNCEEVANPDQQDSDGDGIGDLCDETEPETPDPEDPDPGTITVTSAGCGCSSAPSPMWAVWLAPLALIGLRRRG